MEQIITHPRHEQLRGISKEFHKFFSVDCEGLGEKEQHKLLGYCKQLNIIANELEDTIQITVAAGEQYLPYWDELQKERSNDGKT